MIFTVVFIIIGSFVFFCLFCNCLSLCDQLLQPFLIYHSLVQKKKLTLCRSAASSCSTVLVRAAASLSIRADPRSNPSVAWKHAARDLMLCASFCSIHVLIDVGMWACVHSCLCARMCACVCKCMQSWVLHASAARLLGTCNTALEFLDLPTLCSKLFLHAWHFAEKNMCADVCAGMCIHMRWTCAMSCWKAFVRVAFWTCT